MKALGRFKASNMKSLFAAVLVASFFAVSASASAATLWVNDDDPNGGGYVAPGTDCDDPGYNTITAAHTAALAGDTINVCEGAYNESPTLTKANLTLLGAKSGVPAGPDASPAGRGAGESVVNGSVATHVFRLNNSADGVTIDGFTINTLPVGTVSHGISVAAGSINNTFENNIISSTSAVRTASSSGVLTGSWANQTVSHNNIQGFNYGVQPDGGPLDPSSTIDGNYLANNAIMGVQIQNSAGGGHFITNNVIEMNGFDGIFVTRGNIISGNRINGNGRNGISMFNLAPPSTLTGAMITDNDILANVGRGISVGGADAADVSDNHANENNIVGNGFGIVSTLASTTFDAECNWYGSDSGPMAADNPTGTGDSVTGNVDYTPWLVEEAPAGACTGVPPNPPPSKDACKKGGWMAYTDDQGRPFKNQGDCVSYVATGGKNPAAG